MIKTERVLTQSHRIKSRSQKENVKEKINYLLLCVSVLAISFVVNYVNGNAPFTTQILANGLYKIEHNGANWMDGGGYMFQADGKRYTIIY